MNFFTSDEHYGHKNIIKFCKRPFDSVEEMDSNIINNHNSVVTDDDIVYHLGDFTLKGLPAKEYIKQLNGKHIFIQGNHDRWLKKTNTPHIIQLDNIIMCHYPMSIWNKSCYNSWQLHGHCHGTYLPVGKQWDVGVDNNHFYPVSMEKLEKIMECRPDNVVLID